MKINKIPELLRQIKKAIHSEDEFPIEFILSQGMEFPDYKITIIAIEKDHFIDANGQKWVKAE